MKSKVTVLIAVLTVLGLSASVAYSQGPTPKQPSAVDAAVAAAVSYQGRLTNPTTGAPLSGTYDLEFTFWSLSSGGSQIGATISKNAQVISNGLYSSSLPVNQADFNGQELWLQIRVRPSGGSWETLTPRVQVLPTAYALSLRPGATMTGDPLSLGEAVLNVNMTGTWPGASAVEAIVATGTAIMGQSYMGGYGLYGYSTGDALYAQSSNKTAGIFYTDGAYGIKVTANGSGTYDDAGHFSANNGRGIYATSNGVAILGENKGPGYVEAVRGHSVNGEGVAGDSTNNYGVYGYSGNSAGVYGISSKGSGVYGYTSSDDYTTTGGVYGTQSGNGAAVVGKKNGGLGLGVYGTNTGTSGSGVSGGSTNYMGVWGATARSDGNYGLFTNENLYSYNIHTSGAFMQVVQNGGSEPLEPGDVAVFSGISVPTQKGAAPVIRVAKANSSNSTAVAGVVYSRFNSKVATGALTADGKGAGSSLEITPPGPVPPGEYLLLVVQGPAQVKASAVAGAIRPGDLLSTSQLAGRAARAATLYIGGASTAIPGTVFGKALEPLAADQNLIYVFVTLQ